MTKLDLLPITSAPKKPEGPTKTQPPRLWRSVDHYRGHDETKRWAETEFPYGLAPEEIGVSTETGDAGAIVADAEQDQGRGNFIRRDVLKLMGASMALAGVTGCVRRPEELILPYVKQPEDVIPGVPRYYATAHPSAQGAVGVLVESHEGRPTKIEGNPDHPGSLGRADRYLQAEVLELYDPDRTRAPRKNSVVATWKDFGKEFGAALNQSRDGQGLAVLLDHVSGPTEQRLLHELREKMPKAKVFFYDPMAPDNTVQGAEMVFGPGQRVQPDLTRADVLLAVDDDFFTEGAETIRKSAGYASNRSWEYIQSAKDASKMNRLYAVEANLSSTGANADHRLRVHRREIPGFVQALAVELFGKRGLTLPESLGGAAAAGKLAGLKPTFRPTNAKFLPALAKDLIAHKGKALVLVGEAQPPAVHALAHLINAGLAAFDGDKPAAVVSAPIPPAKGKVDAFFAARSEGGEGGDASAAVGDAAWAFTRPTPHRSSFQDLKALVDELNGGKVNTLVILGGNPVFSSPGGLKLKSAVQKAKVSFHAGLTFNETAKATTWHVPLAHWLESWNDAAAWDGTVSVVQPLIAPLHGGRSRVELLALLSRTEKTDHDLVKETWSKNLGVLGGDKDWRKALHLGSLPERNRQDIPLAIGEGADPYTQYITEQLATVTPQAATKVAQALGAIKTKAPSPTDLDVVFKHDFALADGRYANNAWLQELPDSMTKLCWDNAVVIGPTLAQKLNIKSQVYKNAYRAEVVRFTVNGVAAQLPVFVQPGLAENTAVIVLGYGRETVGTIGKGVGVDTWPLVPADGSMSASGSMDKTGRDTTLCSTQEHFAADTWTGEPLQSLESLNVNFEEERPLAMMGTVGEYKKEPEFAKAGMLSSVVPGLVEPPERKRLTRERVEAEPARPERPIQSTFDVFAYDGQQWGMVIDLTTCTGCHACVVACQSENNIPIVGREQVLFGRELHWIRIDRYYVGDVDEPEGINQPLPCLHCENAPCEPVCPVAATVHDTEGLNVMVYNRCIGTRYCGNNCPVKVRRFNYFDFTDSAHFNLSDEQKKRNKTLHMQRNPDVTVRFRGVIEKCTYCTQRIQEAKYEAKREGSDPKNLKDGAIVPACAQTCPTNAIVFGNITDLSSKVARMKLTDRNYEMLSELNIRPRTTYLAKLKNPNPELV